VPESVRCIECGDQLSNERAELGYGYCTKPECQAVHHRGLVITTVGVNKSADSILLAAEDEIRRRGEAGEFGRKDTALGLNYRGGPTGPTGRNRRPEQPRPAPARSPDRARWTPQQEKIVRLYHEMGLSPRRIAERAQQNAPRLGITERLAVQILSAARR
jgi:hypothetical protein